MPKNMENGTDDNEDVVITGTPYKMKRDGTFVLSSDIRLLLVSSRARFSNQIESVTKPEVGVVTYQYEGSTLDNILAAVSKSQNGKKAECIGLLFHGSETELFVASGKVLSTKSVIEDQSLRHFFVDLITKYLDKDCLHHRVDLVGCPLSNEKAKAISNEMEKLLECPVVVSKDLSGVNTSVSLLNDLNMKNVPIGEVYFDTNKLKDMLVSASQNLAGYEKIRTVGKGAFGTAVLYRKKDDDSLVILKEINMHDLTAGERQLAMNEIRVLSMLDHPNIISYYDSFEQDGVLMIEMEYADGGTLSQYLGQLKRPLEEQEILNLFQQIVSAIKHMHEHNILHRDLKTANIFLTKEGSVKVGDFGISKLLTTRHGGANTVVGTPYYISPEMCEGKPYNQKSDIWALGCILYEMACLQKTFEGSNLPALVNKIVKGQFAPVRGNYSPSFKKLIQDLLQRDPEYRPTCNEILLHKLPELRKQFESYGNRYDDVEASLKSKYQNHSNNAKSSLKQPRTVLYQVKMHEMDISLTPIPLPPCSRIKELALSTTHMIALTYDLLAYSWGDGRKGQLGHGMLEIWRDRPHCVDALKGKNIIRLCAGEGFSVFSCDNGIVMTCGDGSLGCLGHGDWNCCMKPKLVEKLLSVDCSAISCGPHHVVVVTGEGEAYAWGCGNGGRLGTGREDDCCIPTPVQIPDDVCAKNVYCGTNGTMFLTETGSVLACGRNDYNKLGLNQPGGFLMQMKQLMIKTEVEKQLIPTRLRWLRRQVVSISMGVTHTCILVEPGHIISFGCNQYGQLGRGNNRAHSSPSVVKSMKDKTVTMVQCGNNFTVATTVENIVYFWGGRQATTLHSRIESIDLSLQDDPVMNSVKMYKSSETKNPYSIKNNDIENSVISNCSVSEVIKVGESNSPLMTELQRIGPDSSIIQVRTPESRLTDSSASWLSAKRDTEEQYMYKQNSTPGKKEAVLQPQEILALYASPAQIARGEIVSLSNLYCHANRLYLAVDTTAPVPKPKSKKKNDAQNKNTPEKPNKNAGSNNLLDEDSMGPLPEWLKEELANAIIPGSAMDNLPALRNEDSDPTDNKSTNGSKPVDTAITKTTNGGAAPPRHKTAAHFQSIYDGVVSPLSANSSTASHLLLSPPRYKRNNRHSNIPISVRYFPLQSKTAAKQRDKETKVTGTSPGVVCLLCHPHRASYAGHYKTTAQSPIHVNSLSSSAPAATLETIYSLCENNYLVSSKDERYVSPQFPIPSPPSVNSEQESKENQLRKELELLIESKNKTEDKLRLLEMELAQQSKLQQETEEKMKDKEAALQQELLSLKHELENQYKSFTEYEAQMNQLQSQLTKQEMEKTSFSPKTGQWSSERSTTQLSKSRICCIQ